MCIRDRIGGGFGAKQTAVCEIYPAFVTMKTGRPAKLIYTREESQIAGSPRHEMEVRIRLGADKDGHIRCIDLYTLSNTGAYGEHGPTTVGLSGHKAIPPVSYTHLDVYKRQGIGLPHGQRSRPQGSGLRHGMEQTAGPLSEKLFSVFI